jgi:formylglycine-generating enzyme required for sulfatase activity
MQPIYPESGWDVQLLRGGSWKNHPGICRLSYLARFESCFLHYGDRFRVV